MAAAGTAVKAAAFAPGTFPRGLGGVRAAAAAVDVRPEDAYRGMRNRERLCVHGCTCFELVKRATRSDRLSDDTVDAVVKYFTSETSPSTHARDCVNRPRGLKTGPLMHAKHWLDCTLTELYFKFRAFKEEHVRHITAIDVANLVLEGPSKPEDDVDFRVPEMGKKPYWEGATPRRRSDLKTKRVRFDSSAAVAFSRPVLRIRPLSRPLAPRRSLADFVRSPEPTDRLRQRGRKRTSSSASESSRGGSRKRGRRGRNRRRRRRKSRRKNQRRSRRRRSSRSRSDR